jgi:hypothetical protein
MTNNDMEVYIFLFIIATYLVIINKVISWL